MSKPFRVMVYDRTLKPMFSLPLHGAPGKPGLEEVRVSPRHMAIGTASIRLPGTHPRAVALHEPGVRVRIWDEHGQHLLSGPITSVQASRGDSDRGTSTLTLSITDDARLLWKVLGWVQPTKGIDQQGTDTTDARYVITNRPAEYVVKRVFSENTARQGIPVVVLPDLGRGRAITYSSRMQPIADRIYPAVADAGIQVHIRQEDVDGDPTRQRLVLDVSEHVIRPQVMDHRSPQLTDWEYTAKGPDAVRGVAGGQGEGTARVFKASANQAELAAWGAYYGGELWDDQRQESLPASVQAALDALLLEKASTDEIHATLTDTGLWRYGKAWRVGDFVKFSLAPTAKVTQMQIDAADLAWIPGAGYSVTSTVGTAARTVGSTQKQIIKAHAKRVQDLETGL